MEVNILFFFPSPNLIFNFAFIKTLHFLSLDLTHSHPVLFQVLLFPSPPPSLMVSYTALCFAFLYTCEKLFPAREWENGNRVIFTTHNFLI